MAKSKNCNPPKSVRDAARTLSSSKSPALKSKAAKTLSNHKNTKH